MLYVFGTYVLDIENRELRRGNVPVPVERKVFDVLRHLLAQPHRLVSKEELLASVWPGISVEEGAVARCIFAARRAVGDDGRRQRVIRTAHGEGYRFMVPVAIRSHAATPSPRSRRRTEPSGSRAAREAAPDAAFPGRHAAYKAATVVCGVLSPAPSVTLDLDAERELAERIATLIADAARPYDGVVQRLGGDGFSLVFGAPRAQEDHARRAVLAALAIREQWAAVIEWGTIAIGVHTSVVAVADTGARAPHTFVVAGEAPALALAIASAAAAGTVVVTEPVHDLVRGLFDVEPLGARQPSGVAASVARHRVMRQTDAQSRFDVALRTGLTRLIGRDDELATIRRSWEHAVAGDGRVVLVAGEPGIGKTRLVHEFTKDLAGPAPVRITFSCSPYHTQTALHPIIQHLRATLGLIDADRPAVNLERLRHGLTRRGLAFGDTLPLFAALLSLPHPAGVPPLAHSLRKQRLRTYDALGTWLLAEAARGPVCCVWDDLQWADPASLEFVGLCLDHVVGTRLLVVLAFRPEFVPPVAAHSYTSALTLSGLGRLQTAEMVKRATVGRQLPAEVVARLVARADGVPFFIEELTNAAVGEGNGRPATDHAWTADLAAAAVPAVLRDSLLARLDRLNGAVEVVQAAAVVGREFSAATLGAVLSVEPERLTRVLHQLVEAEVIHPRGLPREGRYTFKHALLQEVAYQSLPASRRRSLHAVIANQLPPAPDDTRQVVPDVFG